MRLLYNGIDLGVLDVYQFVVTPVYDDSGVDYLYSKFDIIVRAMVSGEARVLDGFTPARGNGGVGFPPPSHTPPSDSTPLPHPEPPAAPPGEEPTYPPVPTTFQNGPVASYKFAAFDPSGLNDDRYHEVAGNGKPTGVPTPADFTPTPVGLDNFGQSNRRVAPVANSPGVYPGDQGIYADNKGRLRRIERRAALPTETTATIRHRLTTPRGPLWVFSDKADVSSVLLQSPGWGLRCDAKNGPFPKVLAIEQVYGDAATFVVTFGIETYVVESEVNGVHLPGVLLSNRFKQRHDVDERGFTTVSTDGTAIFRADYIYKLKENPDAKRPVLFLPVPSGFVRENIVVDGLPDVTGVRYYYEDRQVHVNFPAGPYVGAASISAVHRQAIVSDGDILEGALSSYERVLGMKANKHFASMGTPERPAAEAKGVMGHPKHPFHVPSPTP